MDVGDVFKNLCIQLGTEKRILHTSTAQKFSNNLNGIGGRYCFLCGESAINGCGFNFGEGTTRHRRVEVGVLNGYHAFENHCITK
eukprot:6464379-Amphidinium_carterae.1